MINGGFNALRHMMSWSTHGGCDSSTWCMMSRPTHTPTMPSQSNTGTVVGPRYISVVREAAKHAPISDLKKSACSALHIFETTQVCTRKNNWSYLALGLSFTAYYRYLRKTKRHTNDFVTINASLSLLFGARLKWSIQRIGYLRKC